MTRNPGSDSCKITLEEKQMLTLSHVKDLQPLHESPGTSRNHTAINAGRSSHLIWAVLTALALRLVVVGFVYPGFLDPGRDHWEFGYEMGKIAYSIANGHGFANPYWIETGPTAMITPIYPYLISSVFLLFGAYSKAAAWPARQTVR